MRTRPVIIMISVIMLIASLASAAEDDLADNPISKCPDFFHLRLEERVTAPTARLLKWSFEPDRARYYLGEPITGFLKVSNVNAALTLEMSPPYNGQYVSTVGVWRKMTKPQTSTSKKGPAWDALKETTRVNKGNYNDPGYRGDPQVRKQFQGKPIVLKPGEQFVTRLVLNVIQPGSLLSGRIGDEGWYCGVGFGEAGRYSVFLRYIDLEEIMPFAVSGDKTPIWPKRDSRKLLLPRKPVVLGPYELEIIAPGAETTEMLETSIADYEREVWRDATTDLIRVVTTNEISTMLDHVSQDNEALATISASLTLSQIRVRLAEISVLDSRAPNRIQLLTQIRDQLRESRNRMQESFLRDSYDLTLCHVLLAMGQAADAKTLARKLGTPDAIVFLDRIEGTSIKSTQHE